MPQRISINLTGLLLLCLFMAAPMVYTHTCTFINVAALLVTIACCYLAGAVVLSFTSIAARLQPITQAGISVFLGILMYSSAILIAPGMAGLMVIFTLVSGFLALLLRKRISIAARLPQTSFIIFGVSLLAFVIVSAEDIHLQFSAEQIANKCYSTDIYYFTSLARSLRGGSILNAAYEVGTPINYQIVGFFPAAMLGNVLHISSHQALWGLAQPFYKLTVFFLCYELFHFFIGPYLKPGDKWFAVLAVLLPVLLAPLHLLYLVRLKVKMFVFNGLGYLVPAGTITYPLAIALFLLSFLLFLSADWNRKNVSVEKVLFAVSAALMFGAKVPLFAAYLLFIGAVVLKRWLINKEPILSYLPYGLGLLVLAALINRLCFSEASNGRNYFRYGYLQEVFAGWYHYNPSGVKGLIITLAAIPFTYLFWLGIRIAGLWGLAKSKLSAYTDVLTGAVASLLGTTILASWLRMEMVDKNGHFILDVTFNTDQFIRASFYIVTISSVIGILYLLYAPAAKTRKAFAIAVAIWIVPVVACLATTYGNNESKCAPLTWYYENESAMKAGHYKDGLLAVNPALNYYGIMLAASDQGIYWTALDRSAGNYNSSLKHDYRWTIVKNFLADPQEDHLRQMKKEGVKYFVATPEDSASVEKAAKLYPASIRKTAASKWIYELL